jgi:hypothetical protein
MSDLEARLRAAMHATVDGEEAAASQVLAAVMRRHRRHTVLVVSLAVLIIVAVAIPTAVALRGLVTAERRPTSHHSKPRPRPLPTQMTGQAVRPSTKFSFLTTEGQRVIWYSTGSRRVQAVSGLSAPSEGVNFDPVPGGYVASDTRIQSFCAAYFCAGPPYQYYFIADGSRRATHIGAGVVDRGAVAASNAGAVWLVSYPHAADNIATTSASVRLMSTRGRPLGPRYRLPAGFGLVRGVGKYLLLYQVPNFNPSKPPKTFPPIVDLLWDPGTGHTVRHLSNVLAAGPEQIAFSPPCRECRVQILNVATGKSVTTPAPSDVTGAVFTDDGVLMAADIPGGEVGVFDTVTGVWTLLPGTALNSEEWQVFEWQPGSRRLVITAGPGRGNPPAWIQVAYWQPGATGLRLMTLRDRIDVYEISYSPG